MDKCCCIGVSKLNFYFENRETPISISRGRGLAPQPHLHNEIEIIVSFDGRSVATADSRSDVLEANDIYIAFPNQIHFYHDDTVRPEHLLIIFSPDIASEFVPLFSSNIPVSPIIKNALSNEHLRWAVEALERVGSPSASNRLPHSAEHMRGLLLVILSELFNMMTLETAPKYDSSILKQVLNYCSENYTQDISLATVAEDLHVNKYYVSHLFSNKLQISFSDYINSLRIKRACALLKQKDMPVIDISFAVGYNSVRSFNRCFKNIRGISPKDYRARRKEL